VAGREIVEKRFVFLAAIAFALLAVIPPLTMHMRGSFGEAITVSAAILATAFALGLAVILGATIVGRELTEDRLSFYFARPLPAAAIWFGKVAASTLLITLSFLIVFAPAVMIGARISTQWTDSPATFAGVVLLAAILLFLLTHTVGTMVRSRSPWIGIDFLCAAATAVAVFAMLRLPLAAHAWTITMVASVALTAGLVLVVLAACTWQVAKGRTNRVQNHLALSRSLWSGVTVVLLAVSSYLLWALAASPRTLTDIRAQGAHDGWLLINGQSAGRGDYRPTFLIHADGRSVRVLTPSWFGIAFSDDGRTAVWLRQKVALSSAVEIISCRLDDPHPHAVSTGIDTTVGEFCVSPDGTRVAIGEDSVTIYELASRRSLGSFHLDLAQNANRRFRFVGRDVVRIIVDVWRGQPMREVYEYDLRTRTLQRTAAFEDQVLSVSDDDTRMLLSRPAVLTLADARSGAPLARIEGSWSQAAFLRDGSFLAVRHQGTTLTADHFAANGTPLREITGSGYLDAHVSGGDEHRAVVQVRPACKARPNCSAWTPAFLDLDRGTMQVPDPSLGIAIFDPTKPLPDEILCTTTTGVVAWNRVTGSKRVVAGH
jgi:ABC-type transport system involved in multi-copper enzyme maturation permease subunit